MAVHVLLGVKAWKLVFGEFRSKETFSDLDPTPNPNSVYFTDQNRIPIGKKFFLCYIVIKVILFLYTVGKYIKNRTKFNKRPYAENKMVAPDECLKISEIRG